jgi:phospholipid-binding lipoprotein MlaA
MVLVFGGCATAPDPADQEGMAEFEAVNDPLEPMNRGIFFFNRGVDALFLKPAAGYYRALMPPPIQRGIRNFLNNLRTPVILVNDLLQGEMDRAGTTLARFAINTTLGVGGLDDPATELGWERHDEDFGQTLAVWGLGEGPFLMLPLLGPSNPRDAVGLAVDSLVFDPIGVAANVYSSVTPYAYGRTGATVVDTRSQVLDELDELEKTSLDFYAALRSLYRQLRLGEIHQGQPPLPDFGPTLEDIPDGDQSPE